MVGAENSRFMKMHLTANSTIGIRAHKWLLQWPHFVTIFHLK